MNLWNQISYILKNYKDILQIQLNVIEGSATTADIINLPLDIIVIETLD